MGDKKIRVCAYPAEINIVAKTKNLSNAGNIAYVLSKNYRKSIQTSKLFYSNGVCLSVKVKTITLPQILGQICEHADVVCIGKNYDSILSEYGKVIYESNAIERLSANR